MRPTRAVLTAVALLLSLVVPLTARQALAAGCGLSFQPSAKIPTCFGAGANGQSVIQSFNNNEWSDAAQTKSGLGCIEPLQDLVGAVPGVQPDCSVAVAMQNSPVTIYSKRDKNQNLFLLFDVTDATTTFQNPTLGDRIIIHFDPLKAGGATLTPTMFRLDFQVPRGANGTAQLNWYNGAGTQWSLMNPPSNLVVLGVDKPSGQPGYFVAMQIPLGAGGLGYNNPDFPEMGIAIAIINDIGCVTTVVARPGDPADGYELLTGTEFPTNNQLDLSNINDPMLRNLSFSTDNAWNKPSAWGTAFFQTPDVTVSINSSPDRYHSPDIKTVKCDVAAFSDSDQPSTNFASHWYQYDPTKTTPCPIGTFGRFEMNMPSNIDISRRVLFLWAESGMAMTTWFFIHLSNPVTIPTGSNTLSATTPPCPWNNVPAKLPAHPCVRVVILPATLNDAKYNQAYFNSLTSISDVELTTQLFPAYNVSNDQWSQMNVEYVSGQPAGCPVCVACQDTTPPGPGDVLKVVPGREAPPELQPIPQPPNAPRAEHLGPLTVRPVAYQAPVRAGAARPLATTNPTPPVPPPPTTDAVIDFQEFGISPLRRRDQGYMYLEPLGAVTKVINLPFLRQKGDVVVHFNLNNKTDVPRSIFVSTKVTLPPGVPPIDVKVPPIQYAFGKGETLPVDVHVGPQAPPPPPPPPPGGGGGPCVCPMPPQPPVYYQPQHPFHRFGRGR